MANPAVTDDWAGQWPLLDWLLPAYVMPAVLAVLAIRHPATAEPKALRPVLACHALFAGFVWITLEIRHLFHLEAMGFDTVPVEDAELWSGAWLAYGAVVMPVGIGMREQKLRLAALAVVGLVVAKVFLVDVGGLDCGGCCRSLASDYRWSHLAPYIGGSWPRPEPQGNRRCSRRSRRTAVTRKGDHSLPASSAN